MMKNILTYQNDKSRNCIAMPNNEERQVLVRLPESVHQALAADAERCRRSIKGQVEAILVAYYELATVELTDIEATREAVSPKKQVRKSPVTEMDGGSIGNKFYTPVLEKEKNKKTKTS